MKGQIAGYIKGVNWLLHHGKSQGVTQLIVRFVSL